MQEIMHSLILGIVQGLTEFLPISSSAHLNVFPWIFDWETISESFDVALHLGTLLAILIYFYKDWIGLIKGGFNKIVKKEDTTEGKMFWYIVIATIPAGIISLILDKIMEKIIGNNIELEMGIIAAALIIMGIILYIVDKKCKSEVSYKNINQKQSLLVGISQAIAAAIPGVSRSGITMTTARLLKIDRESAAKFSFLLAAPIVAAAVIFDITNFAFSVPFFIGILASFIVGLLVIKFLMNYLKNGSFKIFAVYRIVFGIIIYILIFIK